MPILLPGQGWNLGRWPNEPFELNTASPQAQGIVAWWPTLGSRGANVLRDYGGRGLDGTFKGAGEPAWIADAQRGSALSFDGANDYVDFGIIPLTGAFTVAFWLNPDSPNAWTRLAGAETDTNNFVWFVLNHSDGRIYSTVDNDSGDSFNTYSASIVPITNGVWEHFCLTFDGDHTIRGFQNGILRDTNAAFTGSLSTVSETTRIGGTVGSGANAFWEGLLDDFRINNVPLSPAVIWGMAHDKKWDLYRPLRRWWALRSPVSAITPGLWNHPFEHTTTWAHPYH